MEKIILQIAAEMKKQGLSEKKLGDMVGLYQNKVHRIVTGQTKKLDIISIRKMQEALGITDQPQTIAEQIGEGYGPEVKLLADYLEVKVKGKTAEERLQFVEDIMADIRARYK